MSDTTTPKDQESRVREELALLLNVEQLPAMPHSALIVLQLDNDISKVNINDLVRPIEADPGLTAQVLKFLNSAFFGFQSSISNIKQGIALAGIRMVKNFVLWKAVFSLIPKTSDRFFDVKHLWQDSLRRALFAKMIAKELKGNTDLTFSGALLQDMAIPLLLKKKAQQYTGFVQQLTKDPVARLSELEKNVQGWTHADAAEQMCNSWKIPSDLSSLIANHVEVEPYMDEPMKNPDQLAVSLSALLPSVVNRKWTEKDKLEHYMQTLFPTKLQMTTDLFAQVDKEFDYYATALQISKPGSPLIDYLA